MMQKNNYRIRNAFVSDAASIAAVERACFSVPWSEKALAETITQGDTAFFVAEADGAICGYIGAYFVLDEGYITNVAVFEQYRCCGIAKSLITQLIQTAKERKASFLTLEVREGNLAAKEIYKKLGFEFVGVRKHFYSHPTEDAALMTLFLS